jgi:hypothetical protein
LIVASFAAIAAVILGWVAITLMTEREQQAELESAAGDPIDGVEEFPELSRNHVETAVAYPQTPSVGGDHSGVWMNCGVYTSELDPMKATHSLEHGAVWIGYSPDLPAEQVEALTTLAQGNEFVLLSPVDGAPAPVTLSAWGVQLQLDNVDDPRLEVFVRKYQQGPQTPEPGAPCTGGVGA